MAHGLNAILKRGTNAMGCNKTDGKTGIGSRRIFAPQFKLQVLDSYRNDADCKGNQRATARKYGIHRRQIQKWLQVENNLRNSVVKGKCSDLIVSPEARKCGLEMALRSAEHRQRDDVCVEAYSRQQRQRQRCGEAAGDATTDDGVYAREEGTRDAADKRVPDIPQQHSPVAVYATTTTTTTTTLLPLHQHQHHHHLHHEWQPVHPRRHDSPDDASSTRSSHSDRDIVEFFGSPSHCSLSPRSPSCVPLMPLHAYPPMPLVASLHVPPPVVQLPSGGGGGVVPLSSPPCSTPFCSNLSPLPLDFTTHSRRVAPSPDSPRGATRTSPAPRSPATAIPQYEQQRSDSAAPMDLSLKKPCPRAAPDLHAPVPVEATPPAPRITLGAPLNSPTSSTSVLEHDSQIWDLSTKGIKREHDYDDDDEDDDNDDDDIIIDVSTTNPSVVPGNNNNNNNNRPIKLFKPYLDHVIEECPNNNTVVDIKPIVVSYSENDHYYSNCNNNITEIKMEYPPFYKDENYHHGNFYGQSVNGDYYPNGGLHFMDGRLNYEDARFFSKHANAIKQRQSYSLDFKLSAIECYYSDASCRGNQRAVASKFKIHRRQVQKWLKQEDQLRQRNDTKPMHIVR